MAMMEEVDAGTLSGSPGPNAGGHVRIVKAAGIIMGATILGRIAGYGREAVIAGLFGASAATDAFVVSNTIPSIFITLMTTVVGACYIPILAGFLAHRREDEGWQVTRTLAVATLLVVTVIAGLGALLAPYYIPWLAPGFDPASQALAANLARIQMGVLVLTGLGGLVTAVLQSYQQFAAPALGPLALNLVVISAALGLAGRMGVYALAYGFVGGAALQLAIQIPPLLRLRRASAIGGRVPLASSMPDESLASPGSPGLLPAAGSPRLDFGHPALWEVAKLLPPVLITSGVGLINVMVDRIFASALSEGSIAALSFADRVVEIPLGVFAAAIATAAFPTMAGHVARGDRGSLRQTLTVGLRSVSAITVPAAVGLMVLATPVIRLLFERGRFDAQATSATAIALVFFAIGIIPSSWHQILMRTYYSLKDIKTPAVVGVFMIGLNALLDWVLIRPMGHGGLALSTSLVAITYVGILCFLLQRRAGLMEWRPLADALLRIGAATAAMAGVAYLASAELAGRFGSHGLSGQLVQVGGAIAAAAVVYLVVVALLRLPEVAVVGSLFWGRIRVLGTRAKAAKADPERPAAEPAIASLAEPVSAPPASLQRPLRLVVFGDCIPAGIDVEPQQRYPELLAQMSRSRRHERLSAGTGVEASASTSSVAGASALPALEVVNAGQPGDTTIAGLKRLERDVLSHHPDVVLIGFGINDALPRARSRWLAALMRRLRPARLRDYVDRLYEQHLRMPILRLTGGTVYVAPTAYRSNLARMVERVRAVGARPILMTTTICTRPSFPGANDNFARYNQIVYQLGQELDVPVIDLFTPVLEAGPEALLGPDLLHLTPQGHQFVAEKIMLSLEQMAREHRLW